MSLRRLSLAWLLPRLTLRALLPLPLSLLPRLLSLLPLALLPRLAFLAGLLALTRLALLALFTAQAARHLLHLAAHIFRLFQRLLQALFSVERHIHVLSQHAPDFTVHDIVVDASRVPSEREREQLRRTANILEARVEFADVSRPGTPLHDPARLAAALEGVRLRGVAPPASTVPTPTVNGPRGDDPWR